MWGCCYYDKYLKRIDKLFARAFKSGYCLKKYSICDILTTRDSTLWNKITANTTALDDLLPPRRARHLRSRGHDYILPRGRTSRFKSTFVNRCRGGYRSFFRRGCTRLLLYFNTNKPHSFCRIPVVLENRWSSQGGGGGGCAPPTPSP